jgi:hypothetical protein
MSADGPGPVREDGGRHRGQPRLRAGISEVLAAEGAAVVFSGRQRGPVTATETAIRAAGGKAVGVVVVMKTLAEEYGPYGITANVIATAPLDSELSRDCRASGPGVKTEDWYRTMLPAGRWGDSVEMGWLAAFLCSERAAPPAVAGKTWGPAGRSGDAGVGGHREAARPLTDEFSHPLSFISVGSTPSTRRKNDQDGPASSA